MHFHNINKEGILFYLTMKFRDEHSFLTVSWKIFFSMFIIETIENLFQKILLAHTFHNNYILSMIYFVDWSPPKANVLMAADSKVEKEICTRTLPLALDTTKSNHRYFEKVLTCFPQSRLNSLQSLFHKNGTFSC